MANLKEIRNRISSVSSTMQITSAMKMVSAAKLKRAQDAITAMRPYAEKLTELIQNLSGSLTGDAAGKYAEQREVNKVLINEQVEGYENYFLQRQWNKSGCR